MIPIKDNGMFCLAYKRYKLEAFAPYYHRKEMDPTIRV